MKSRNVLVLHPNDELKIIALQDRIKEGCKPESKKVLLKLFPLWSGPLSPEITEAVIEKRIIDVTVLNPLYSDGFVYCPVNITFYGTDETKTNFETRINILKGIWNSDISDFRFSLKVFRIAEKHEHENQYWLTDSMWLKLKKEQR